MPFTFKVEDGTGYEDANSYSTVEYADNYISFYHPEDTSWNESSVEDKERRLILATSFLDGSSRWQSSLQYPAKQVLEWPRISFTDLNGREVKSGQVPQVIIDSTVALAFSSMSSTLSTASYSLIEERLGDTADKYSAPVTMYENEDVAGILSHLKALGYAQSRGAYVNIQRG